MLRQLLDLVAGTERLKAAGRRRSSRWPAARKAHLLRQPACAACGGAAGLEVHHVRPFHLFPELELDPANLMTLCESRSRNCHHLFGHGLDWRLWNPLAREDAAACLAMLARVRARP